MGRNSDIKRDVENLRLRLRRSSNGKVLGVFRGIAESLNLSVCWTRIIGGVVLLAIAGSCGAEGPMVSILVSGFFYLLLALFMQPPHPGGSFSTADDHATRSSTPPRSSRPAAVPYQQAPQYSPHVNLAHLDRQLESLNRRIQRMETVVTDRQYDWDRRLDS